MPRAPLKVRACEVRRCRGSSYSVPPSPNPLPGFSRPAPSPPRSHTSRCCRRLGALPRAHVSPASASASVPPKPVPPQAGRPAGRPRDRLSQGPGRGGKGGRRRRGERRFPLGGQAAAARPAGAAGAAAGRALPPRAEVGVSGRPFLTSSLFSTSLNSRLIRCTAMLAMSLPAADSYPPPPPPLRPPPPPPPLPPPPPPSVIQTRAHERCHCHPCRRRVPPQCRITSAPGHQNGAGSAHAHHADPGGRRSRSCGSPIRLSSEPAPRRAAPRVSAGASGAWLRPAGVWGEEGAASAPVSGVWAWPVLPCPSAPFPGRLGPEVGAPPGGFPTRPEPRSNSARPRAHGLEGPPRVRPRIKLCRNSVLPSVRW